MDAILFEEWVKELDQKVFYQGKNIVLKRSNCPVHRHIDNLKAIKLFFIPPDKTSKAQPMNQG